MTNPNTEIENLPKLDVKVKTIREVDYAAVERFLTKLFGIEMEGYRGGVSLIADNEWHNDSQYIIYVNKPRDDDDPEEYFDMEYGEGVYKKLTDLYERNAEDKTGLGVSSSAMLDFAAYKMWIPTGEYTVDVMW